MNYNQVLIDTPNIFNRAFHKNKALGKEVNNCVPIFLSMINKIQRSFLLWVMKPIFTSCLIMIPQK